MQLISTETGAAVVSLSADELVLLNNALNETLEAVDEEEFDTRVGGSIAEVIALLGQVRSALDALR